MWHIAQLCMLNIAKDFAHELPKMEFQNQLLYSEKKVNNFKFLVKKKAAKV